MLPAGEGKKRRSLIERHRPLPTPCCKSLRPDGSKRPLGTGSGLPRAPPSFVGRRFERRLKQAAQQGSVALKAFARQGLAVLKAFAAQGSVALDTFATRGHWCWILSRPGVIGVGYFRNPKVSNTNDPWSKKPKKPYKNHCFEPWGAQGSLVLDTFARRGRLCWILSCPGVGGVGCFCAQGSVVLDTFAAQGSLALEAFAAQASGVARVESFCGPASRPGPGGGSGQANWPNGERK